MTDLEYLDDHRLINGFRKYPVAAHTVGPSARTITSQSLAKAPWVITAFQILVYPPNSALAGDALC